MAFDIETVKEIAGRYADDVRSIYPVDKVILFGSYAKGEATKQSDIDVCFFMDDFDNKRRVDVIKDLLGIMRKYKKIHFEPIVFSAKELQNDNPFIKEIIHTGIEINFHRGTETPASSAKPQNPL